LAIIREHPGSGSSRSSRPGAHCLHPPDRGSNSSRATPGSVDPETGETARRRYICLAGERASEYCGSMRSRADWLSFLAVTISLSIPLLGFVGVLPLAALPLLVLSTRWLILVQHNHLHRPILCRTTANRFIELLLGAFTGIPQSLNRVHHIETHHRYNNTARDWTRPFHQDQSRSRDRPVALTRYVATFAARAFRQGIPLVTRSRGLTRLTAEVATALAVASLALALGGVEGAAWVTFGWLTSAWALPIANWKHHAGCSYENSGTSANLASNWFSGVWGLNVRFHAAHHLRPLAHWSQLPEIHQKMVEAAERATAQPFSAESGTTVVGSRISES
jgi:fatty acid desaturase